MASRPGRQKCYLCDLPHSPWAVLSDFSEVVCRGCCNYEGPDRVEEVIQLARAMRQAHAHDTMKIAANGTSSRDSTDTNTAQVSLPHHHSVAQGDFRYESGGLPNTGHPAMDRGHANLCKRIPPSHHEERTLDGLPSPPAAAAGSYVPYPPVRSPHTVVRDTLAVLNKCVPFNVRFTKDRSLVGRIFAFDAIVRGTGEYEIKAYVEYPPGSNNIYQSASGASKQMYTEYRERMGVSSPRQGAASNGYKDLEFERTPGDWHVLGALLPEVARYFRAPINSDLLPAPYIDPACPCIPSPFSRGTTAELGRKRSSDMTVFAAMGEASESKVSRGSEGRSSVGSVQEVSGGVDHSQMSPNTADVSKTTTVSNLSREQSPNTVRENAIQNSSPIALPSLVPAGYLSRMPTYPVGKACPPTPSASAPLQCLLCHCPLQDTRFVQCPSVGQHKFCFGCSRDSIVRAQHDGTDVFCPSGHHCPVVGSNMPWAFMQAEIETILRTGIGGTVKKET